MSRLTEAQQARLDQLLAEHVPASITRTPLPSERGKGFVRPFERQQVLTLVKENVTAHGTEWRKVEAHIRWDDQCSNGHNSFSVTGSAWEAGRPMRKDDPDTCGCIHDLLSVVFPQLRKLITYHLMDSRGPMHYVANTLYHASARDHNGKLKGEPFRFETFYLIGTSPLEVHIKDKVIDFVQEQIDNGITSFCAEAVPYVKDGGRDYDFGPKYKLEGMPACKWHEAPFDEADAKGLIQAFNRWAADPDFIKPVRRATAWGEGKIPNFEHARACAMWPDATDEQLQDADQLIERLPALISTFKADLEAFAAANNWEGFTY